MTEADFEVVYAENLEFARTYVRRRIGNPADVEDLTQEAFMRLAIKLRQGVDDGRWHTQKWLCRVLHNLCIDHWRRKAVRAGDRSLDDELPVPELRVLESRHGNPEHESEIVSIRKLMRRASSNLSEVDQTVLELRELRGLSYNEMARALDKSGSAVETAIFRARRNLAKYYRKLEREAV